jgi:hypothetical protein
MIVIVLLLNSLVIGFLSWLISKKMETPVKKMFWAALLLKLMAGIMLGLVYTYYYKESDTFQFFADARVLNAFAKEHPLHYFDFLWTDDVNFPVWDMLQHLQSRSLFFVKFLSLINFITGENYWISSLWFSFLSFLGCWYLFRQLTDLIKDAIPPAAISLLFFPSFVFWGSGIIKESIAIGALSFIVGFFLKLLTRQRPIIIEWLLMPVAAYFLWNLKYYWAAVLFPTLITSLVMVYGVFPFFKLRAIMQFIVWMAFFTVFCIGTSFLHPNFSLEVLLEVIVDNHHQFINVSKEDGVIHFYQLTASWLSVVLNAPWAFLSGLFRPFITESVSGLKLVSALENLLLLILCITNLKNLKRINSSPYQLIIYSAMVYVALLCIFLALSTPNLGTLSRYRIGFLPVFLLLIFYGNPLLDKVPFFRSFMVNKK